MLKKLIDVIALSMLAVFTASLISGCDMSVGWDGENGSINIERNMTVLVKDQNGAGVQSVDIAIYDMANLAIGREGTTDSNGRVVLAVPTGQYYAMASYQLKEIKSTDFTVSTLGDVTVVPIEYEIDDFTLKTNPVVEGAMISVELREQTGGIAFWGNSRRTDHDGIVKFKFVSSIQIVFKSSYQKQTTFSNQIDSTLGFFRFDINYECTVDSQCNAGSDLCSASPFCDGLSGCTTKPIECVQEQDACLTSTCSEGQCTVQVLEDMCYVGGQTGDNNEVFGGVCILDGSITSDGISQCMECVPDEDQWALTSIIDDNIDCTVDECIDGVKTNNPSGCLCHEDKLCENDNPCKTVQCVNYDCIYENKQDGSLCEDDNACDGSETCNSGECIDEIGFTCNDNNACTTDKCDIETGCYTENLETPYPGTCAQASTCDPATGLWTLVLQENYCYISGVCYFDGIRRDGNTSECYKCDTELNTSEWTSLLNDGNDCTIDSCIINRTGNEVMQHLLDTSNPVCECMQHTDCDDSIECTQDTCDANNQCVNQPIYDDCDCMEGKPCLEKTCTNVACENYVCVEENQASGTVCDDKNDCTHTDVCDSGGGCSGEQYTCEDNNVCTIDECTGDGGCNHTSGNEGGVCDDENSCTYDDECNDGTCGGTSYTCEDNNVCTTNECTGDGGCNYLAGNNGGVCDDSDPCTYDDECNGGTCAGTNYTCEDNNVCTTNECDGLGDCNYTVGNEGGVCDDLDPCTKDDECTGGTCGGTDYTCEDNNDCTIDECTGDGGCNHSPGNEGSYCDDQDLCTYDTLCDDSGNCLGGNTINCNNTTECTMEVCNNTSVCAIENVADGTECDDSNEGTDSSACYSGVCTACTCDEENECCDGCITVANSEGLSCTPEEFCVVSATCSNGSCEGSHRNCDGANLDTCKADASAIWTDSSAMIDVEAVLSELYKCDDLPQSSSNIDNEITSCLMYSKLYETRVDNPGYFTLVASCIGTITNGTDTKCDIDPESGLNSILNCLENICYNGANSGVTCDDNNACTGDDGTCDGLNACTGATVTVTCDAPGVCQQNGVCNEESGQCEYEDAENGTLCDDGNAETIVDVCSDGFCIDQSICECQEHSDCCNGCYYINPGQICGDSFCTADWTCNSGSCSGTPRDCDPSTGLSTCKTEAGWTNENFATLETFCGNIVAQCSTTWCECFETFYPKLEDGTLNHMSTCIGDVVLDSNNCNNIDSCLIDHCATQADDANCDDLNVCTNTDKCLSGECVGSNETVCNTPGICEQDSGICNPSDGTCSYTPKVDGTICDDDTGVDEQCLSGICTACDCDETNECCTGCFYQSGTCGADFTCIVTDSGTCDSGDCNGTLRDCDPSDSAKLTACETAEDWSGTEYTDAKDFCVGVKKCTDNTFLNDLEWCECIDMFYEMGLSGGFTAVDTCIGTASLITDNTDSKCGAVFWCVENYANCQANQGAVCGEGDAGTCNASDQCVMP